MKKQRYLAELQRLLIYMTAADRAETLRRYGILFDRAGPEGEDELIRRIGSPTNTSIRLSRNYTPGDIRDAFFPDGAPEDPAPEPAPGNAEAAGPDLPEGPEEGPGGPAPDESGDAPAEDEPPLPSVPLRPVYNHSLVEEELPDLPDLELPDLPDLPEPPAPPEPEMLPDEEDDLSDGEAGPADEEDGLPQEPESPEEGPAPAGEETAPSPEQDAPEGPAPAQEPDAPAEGEAETGAETGTGDGVESAAQGPLRRAPKTGKSPPPSRRRISLPSRPGPGSSPCPWTRTSTSRPPSPPWSPNGPCPCGWASLCSF